MGKGKLSIEEIEAIFEEYRIIQPPKHVVVIDALFSLPDDDSDPEGTIYRGLSPNWRDDMIILSLEGDDETVIHECLHANYGTEEWFTYPFAEWLVKKHNKNNWLKHIPKSRKDVEYYLCNGCSICDDPICLGVGLKKKDMNKVRHYIRKYSHRRRMKIFR